MTPPTPATRPDARRALRFPEPVQQPERLVRDDHDLVAGAQTLLHHVGKVPRMKS